MPESKTKKKTGDGSARAKAKTTTKAKTAETTPEKPKTTRRASAKKAQADVVVTAAPAAAPSAPATVAAQPAPQQFWRRMDIHMHTLGSHDYEQPGKTYLDILQQAERRGLDIIAFTDHNTVNGYRAMRRQIEDLELLEKLGRIHPDEQGKLDEYRRLLNKILVLPGFEFTATFGFHILGIFSPDKPAREIEQLLTQLRVPSKVIDEGLTEAGATSDVLAAYAAIDAAGGIAIAAHANSSNGVSMRNMNLGGQTRIAFTQDPHLHALEFTDLDKGRFSSGRLFTAVRAEYPRRMHLLQGSDAHRVTGDPSNPKRLGIGDRVTEVWLENVSFDALRDLLLTQEFDKVRPTFAAYAPKSDPVREAREAGAGPMRSFHPALPKRGDGFAEVVKDVGAMANGQGGVIFIGCDTIKTKKVPGVTDPAKVSRQLSEEIVKRVFPAPKVSVETREAAGTPILCVVVHPDNKQRPFLVDGTYLVRDAAENRVATREDLIAIIRAVVAAEQPAPTPYKPQHAQNQVQAQAQAPAQAQPQNQNRQDVPNRQDGPRREQRPAQNKGRAEPQRHAQNPKQDGQRRPLAQHAPQQPPRQQPPTPQPEPPSAPEPIHQNNGDQPKADAPAPGMPRTGVQIVGFDERDGVRYFTVRDLRKGNVVPNVTLSSARDLWHYAVNQTIEGAYTADKINWAGDRAVLSKANRAGKLRYDLAMRGANGEAQIFFGVTEDGLDESWKELLVGAGELESQGEE
jgi:hypothetical protein